MSDFSWWILWQCSTTWTFYSLRCCSHVKSLIYNGKGVTFTGAVLFNFYISLHIFFILFRFLLSYILPFSKLSHTQGTIRKMYFKIQFLSVEGDIRNLFLCIEVIVFYIYSWTYLMSKWTMCQTGTVYITYVRYGSV